MSTANQVAEVRDPVAGASSSKRSVWVGRVLSGLVVLFLIPDGIIKFIKPAPVVDAFAHLGWPLSLANVIAVATHLRAGDPLFSHVLFPTYLGVVLWLGLYLREGRLRAVIPLRS